MHLIIRPFLKFLFRILHVRMTLKIELITNYNVLFLFHPLEPPTANCSEKNIRKGMS